MRNITIGIIWLGIFVSFASEANPTNQQYQDRVKYEKVLRAEVIGDGTKMTKEQADGFSNQIISAIQTINSNQLSAGMDCKDVLEFFSSQMDQKITDVGMASVLFSAKKYLMADCAIKAEQKKSKK